jgi:hypothetical protein
MPDTDRPMRRKDRELTEEEAYAVIRHTPHAVLCTADASGQPYGVPVSPVLVGNYLVFHGAADPNGRKWENMRENAKVSVTFVGRAETASDEIPKDFSVNYASAIVTGIAIPVTDEAEKKEFSRALARRHVPEAGDQGFEDYYTKLGAYIQLWKIEITKVTGKARNKQGYFNKIRSNTLDL